MKWLKPVWQWGVLAALSLALSLALAAVKFPAAFLLGPMLVGIGFGLRGARLRIGGAPFVAAQGIVGCMIARALDPGILQTLAEDWLPMLLVIVTTVLASAFVGWLLVRMRTLPGTTAAWGSSPGAASGMVAMAEDFGADPRLVAFMQYLRVTVVVATAAAVTHWWFAAETAMAAGGAGLLGGSGAAVPAWRRWLGADPLALAATLAIAGGGGWLGRAFRIPSGSVFLPLIAGAVLQGTGVVALALPPWLLAAGFAAIGWYVGLRFDRATVLYAVRAVPAMMAGIVALIVLCMGSAALLVWWLDAEPLAAYLATSPGGLDAVAIIAVDTDADVSFVLTLQTVRLFVVMLTGPFLARAISKWA